MIGLDTSAIIDFFKGDEKIKRFIENNKEPLAVTTISYLELFFGLDITNSKHEIEAKYYKEFFKNLYNLDLTKDSCEKASEIFWKLRKEGKTIEQFDCVIAALFLKSGIKKIVTRNKKHFENIKELNIIDY
ncbi:type II toxin-antitoxin system VapC family toxin [Candidatus Woesearchaeota archaeon]|nr:type II toxin-antitoxin system VapC family toxin [Candidatus Woesearchaeota archaeon]